MLCDPPPFAVATSLDMQTPLGASDLRAVDGTAALSSDSRKGMMRREADASAERLPFPNSTVDAKRPPRQAAWSRRKLTHSVAVVSRAPMELLSWSRFDIYVKWAYAGAFLQSAADGGRQRGRPPEFAETAYLEHLAALNGFRERCLGGHNSMHNSTCRVKTTPADFLDSFNDVLMSMRRSGFVLANDSRRAVPACEKPDHVEGAAHRLAASLALGLKVIPTRPMRTVECARAAYSAEMLRTNGLHSVWMDWAVHHAIRRDPSLYVVHVWPRAVMRPSGQPYPLPMVRTIVAARCALDGGIVYDKMIPMSKHAMMGYLRHAYGDVSWVQTKYDMVKAAENVSSHIYALVLRSNAARIASCKSYVRKFFSNQFKQENEDHHVDIKASVHITDFHSEAIVAAQMLFNENSLAYLHHVASPGNTTCMKLAQAISADIERAGGPKPPRVESSHRRHEWTLKSKRGQQRVMNKGAAALHLIPEELLVDTGSAMAILGLREPTDVDIIAAPAFKGNVASRLLRKCPEPRPGAKPRHSCERSYGSHQPPSFWFTHHNLARAVDLVHDPTRYAFCWGLKFTAPVQLAEYKQRRIAWRVAARAQAGERAELASVTKEKEVLKDKRDAALLSGAQASCASDERNGFCCDLNASVGCPRVDFRGAHVKRLVVYPKANRRTACRVMERFRSASCTWYGCMTQKFLEIRGHLLDSEREMLRNGTFDFSLTQEQRRRLRRVHIPDAHIPKEVWERPEALAQSF